MIKFSELLLFREWSEAQFPKPLVSGRFREFVHTMVPFALLYAFHEHFMLELVYVSVLRNTEKVTFWHRYTDIFPFINKERWLKRLWSGKFQHAFGDFFGSTNQFITNDNFVFLADSLYRAGK